MTEPNASRMKNLPHPGGFIRTEVIDPHELSVTEAAKALGIIRATLSSFLNERSSLSPDMAIRIEKALGVGMDTLMRMQNSYGIARTCEREGEIKVAPFQSKARAASQQPTV